MKRFILTVIFCLVCGFAYADASFEILSQDIDNNGNIRVWAVHSVNGVEVESNYPKMKDKDGKEHFVYCTRYSKQNFKDCTDKTAIENKILDDIKNYSNNLVVKAYDSKAEKTLNQIRIDYNKVSNEAFMTTNLDKLVGKTLSVVSVVEKLDTDNDGTQDKELTLTTAGTKTEKAITIEAIVE